MPDELLLSGSDVLLLDGNDALLLSDDTVTNTGPPNSGSTASLYFDGIAAWLPLAGVPCQSVDEWSLACMVRFDRLNQSCIVMMNGWDDGLDGDGFGFGMGDGAGGAGSKLVGMFPGIGWIDSGYTFVNSGQWYSVAMRRTGGVTSFLVDGVQCPNTSTLTPKPPTAASLGSTAFGRWFAGRISDSRGWDVPLDNNHLGVYAAVVPDADTLGLGQLGTLAFFAEGASISGLDDGDAVSAWPAIAGYDATQSITANKPTYVESWANGQPGVRFDGLSEVLAVPHDFDGDVPFTIMVVFEQLAIPNDTTGVLFGSSSCDGWSVGVIDLGNARLSQNCGSPADSSSTSYGDGSVTLMTIKYDGSTCSFYRNGVSDGSVAFVHTFSGGGNFYIGGFTVPGLGGTYFNGIIGAIVLYSEALGNTDRSTAEASLMSRFGIT